MGQFNNDDNTNRAGQGALDLGQILGQGGGQMGASSGAQQGQGAFDVTHPQNGGIFQQWLLDNGTADSGPADDQIAGAFNNWTQSGAQPQQVQEATSHVLATLPHNERSNFVQQLLNVFQQNGVSPAQAGVHQTDPNQMSSGDVGRLLGYAQQQQPDLLQQLLGSGGLMNNPVMRMVLSGILAYAANRFLGGMGNMGTTGNTGYNQPAFGAQGYQQPGYPQGLGGQTGGAGGLDLGNIINMFLGGQQ